METRYVDAVADVADIFADLGPEICKITLLTAAAKSGKPIMLKRHFGCSLRDWLGAAEYILVGNNNVILCERGVVAPHTRKEVFSLYFRSTSYSSSSEITHLPVVSDPSHATFGEIGLAPMALASIAAGADARTKLEVQLSDPKN